MIDEVDTFRQSHGSNLGDSAWSHRPHREYDRIPTSESRSGRREKIYSANHVGSLLLVEFEHLGEVGEVAAAILRNQDHVLDSYGSQSGIVQPWFNGDNVAFLKK